MLPRLQAEERLNAINDGAVASGAVKKHDSRQMLQRLERAAKGGRRAPAAKADPAALAKMGIGVAFDGGPHPTQRGTAPADSSTPATVGDREHAPSPRRSERSDGAGQRVEPLMAAPTQSNRDAADG